jgi:uncharacterized membrane protein
MGNMISQITDYLANISPEIASALLATLPVTELRGALPIALVVFELNPIVAYVSTVIGNLVPMALIYLILPRLVVYARNNSKTLDLAFQNWFEKLKNNYGDNYSKWGAFFLLLFVAIPLPGTGVWTGTVLSILFDIKRELAIPYIVLGLLIAGLIVLGLTQGIFHGIQLL